MISLLIYVLVLLIVFGVVFYCIRLLPLEEPFKTIAIVIVLLIFVLVLLGVVGIIPGMQVRPLASLIEHSRMQA
jgi:heme A synthase